MERGYPEDFYEGPGSEPWKTRMRLNRTLEVHSGVRNKFKLEGKVVDVDKIKEEEMGLKLEWLENLEEITVGGETTLADAVVSTIVGLAAQEVEGVSGLGTASVRRSLAKMMGREAKTEGVDSEHGKKEAVADVTLKVIYGYNIPTIVIDVRKKVAERLLEICGLVAKEINIQITAIEFPEKMPGKLE